MDQFPSYLRALRERAGLTQDELAAKCEFGGQSRIGNYESGKRRPDLVDAARIADALGSSRREIVERLAADAGITLEAASVGDVAEVQVVVGVLAKVLADSLPAAGVAVASQLAALTARHTDWQFAADVLLAVEKELPPERRRG
jgi:transcriptional regulator with XRE-family HTH domain